MIISNITLVYQLDGYKKSIVLLRPSYPRPHWRPVDFLSDLKKICDRILSEDRYRANGSLVFSHSAPHHESPDILYVPFPLLDDVCLLLCRHEMMVSITFHPFFIVEKEPCLLFS